MPETMKELNVFFFSSAGPLVALLILIGSLVAQRHFGVPSGYFLVLAIATFGRSLVEWLLHRYIWHTPAVQIAGLRIVNPIASLHMKHHLDPDNPEGVLFSGKMVFFLLIFVAIFGGLFLGIQSALTVLTVASLMLLFYEWFHLLAHSNVEPRFSFLKEAAHQHRHHHIYQQECFGVSQLWADRLLRTRGSCNRR